MKKVIKKRKFTTFSRKNFILPKAKKKEVKMAMKSTSFARKSVMLYRFLRQDYCFSTINQF
jgi:hypothetical protein